MTRCFMFRLKDLDIVERKDALNALPDGKLLINTINAHSYNVARCDPLFAEALTCGDVLIPDGMSIVKACKWIRAKSRPQERIAGWDLFEWEMSRLNEVSRKEIEGEGALPSHQVRKSKVMFMGSSEETLTLDVKECNKQYPYLEVVTYSPPYKPVFSEEDNRAIIQAINDADPDLLWIGMTAPKQEKWTYVHWKELDVHCHVGTIGAVFDFFAGTVERAPQWWQQHGVEWLYRLLKEPRRMWRRYIVGNTLFLFYMLKESIRK